MLVIGLTGGIGSGKTTVANLFAALGTPIIDTDLIARQLVEPGEPALSEIVDHFGKEILLANGELDRSKLADITFQDKQNRQQLEAILHPRIRQEMRRQLAAVKSPYAIVVIPLLVETQQMQEVDRVLLVDCPENIQMQRIQARDNRPIQQIESIIQSQASRQQRLQFADDVVNNVASMEELKDQVAQLHHKYSGLSPN